MSVDVTMSVRPKGLSGAVIPGIITLLQVDPRNIHLRRNGSNGIATKEAGQPLRPGQIPSCDNHWFMDVLSWSIVYLCYKYLHIYD